jgi:hypothetical protein
MVTRDFRPLVIFMELLLISALISALHEKYILLWWDDFAIYLCP